MRAQIRDIFRDVRCGSRPQPGKVEQFRPPGCEGRVFISARNITCRRPGERASHSSSNRLTWARCNPSCEPQRSQDDRVIHIAGELLAIGLGDIGEGRSDVNILLHSIAWAALLPSARHGTGS